MIFPRSAGSVGVIGCGAVARQVYLDTLPRVPGVSVNYVFDLNRTAAEGVAQGLGCAVADVETIGRSVETVIIATPPSSHYALTKTCIELGANVVCEKPFVGLPSEAEELVALAATRGVKLSVGHFRRTFPSLELARGLITSGVLGQVKAIRVAEGGRFTWQASSGYVSSDPFGGVLFDTGSHAIDMALFCTGWDERDLVVRVDNVQRDRPEPAHEIDARFEVRSGAQKVGWDIRLSRYQVMANKVRIELERAVVDVPVGPRDRIRVTGETGTSVITAQLFDPQLSEYFFRQWRATLGSGDNALFDARRFVGLTRILAAIRDS